LATTPPGNEGQPSFGPLWGALAAPSFKGGEADAFLLKITDLHNYKNLFGNLVLTTLPAFFLPITQEELFMQQSLVIRMLSLLHFFFGETSCFIAWIIASRGCLTKKIPQENL